MSACAPASASVQTHFLPFLKLMVSTAAVRVGEPCRPAFSAEIPMSASVRCSMTAFLLRRIPMTVGLRTISVPLQTESTAGTAPSYSAETPSFVQHILSVSPSIANAVTAAAIGRPSRSDSCGAMCPVSLSIALRPQRMRSKPPSLFIAAAMIFELFLIDWSDAKTDYGMFMAILGLPGIVSVLSGGVPAALVIRRERRKQKTRETTRVRPSRRDG